MAQSFRILLVEDDDSLRVCLTEYLATEGWNVIATGQGNEAIGMAQNHRFDFSILDMHLPGMTGARDLPSHPRRDGARRCRRS